MVGVIVLVCNVGAAQDRLGEVAGSIKLNPDAITETEGFVEDPKTAIMADHELFRTVLGDCSITADAIGDMVDEARSTILYRDDVLPTRLGAATLDLDTQIQEIYLLRLSDDFARPKSTARDAADQCARATESIREELSRQGVAFATAKEEITECREGLTRAMEQLESTTASGQHAGSGDVAATDEEVVDEGPSDDEVIDEVCRSKATAGSDAFDACVGRQNRALAALSSRTPENELLDPSAFDEIRAICSRTHPSDFYLRDQCEVEKMTTLRLATEAPAS
jgi:hypothetical protein